MRNFNNTDGIIFLMFLLFAIPAGILLAMGGFYDDPNDPHYSKHSGTYFWIGLSLCIVASIFMLVFFIRTGIDLSEPTVTNTNIRGVQQISPGFDLF